MSIVETRYAKALVDISMQKNQVDLFRENLKLVVKYIETYPDIVSMLNDITIESATKKGMLQKIFAQEVENDILSFLMLLVDKGRTKYIKAIQKEFNRIADEQNNILNITIASALPLQENEVNDIKLKFQKLYNASSVKAEVKFNKSLIGGVQVKVGDWLYDGTLKNSLEDLRKHI